MFTAAYDHDVIYFTLLSFKQIKMRWDEMRSYQLRTICCQDRIDGIWKVNTSVRLWRCERNESCSWAVCIVHTGVWFVCLRLPIVNQIANHCVTITACSRKHSEHSVPLVPWCRCCCWSADNHDDDEWYIIDNFIHHAKWLKITLLLSLS